MDVNDRDEGYYAHNHANVIIVPATPYHHELPRPRKGSPSRREAAQNKSDPSNFLLRGGTRAAQAAQQLHALNTSAVQDLRSANGVLASELLRMQTSSHEERDTFKLERETLIYDLQRVHQSLQAERDQMAVLKARLADELHKRQALEAQQKSRLKEVAKRLREDHVHKQRALQAELDKQSNQALVYAELRAKLQSTQASLEALAKSRAEFREHSAMLQAQLKGADEQVNATTRRLQAAESQLGMAAKQEQQLRRLLQELQADRIAHKQLQADAALERSRASNEQAELERLRRQHQLTCRRAEELERDNATLRGQLTEAQQGSADLQAGLNDQRAHLDDQKAQLGRLRHEADAVMRQHRAREECLAAELLSKTSALQGELDRLRAAARDMEVAHRRAREEVAVLKEGDAAWKEQARALVSERDDVMTKLASKSEEAAEAVRQVRVLQQQVEALQGTSRQQESALSEQQKTFQAHAEAWKEESAQLSASSSKWKQKAATLQQELEVRDTEVASLKGQLSQAMCQRQVAVEELQGSCKQLRTQLEAVESASMTAARQAGARLEQVQGQLASAQEDVQDLRAQLASACQQHEACRCDATNLRTESRRLEHELERAHVMVSEEQLRTGKLRQELNAAIAAHSRELEASQRAMDEVSGALRLAQVAQRDGEAEIVQLRAGLMAAEEQLAQHRTSLAQALDAKGCAEDAHAQATAALRTAERKATQAKQDNNSMLHDYDSYLANLLSKRPQNNSGSAPGVSEPQSLTAGHGRSLLSRPMGGREGDDCVWQAEVDKYDKIAVLLAGRQGDAGHDMSRNAGAHGRLAAVPGA